MKEFTAHQDIFLEEFIQVNAPTLSNVSMNELEIDFKKYSRFDLRIQNLTKFYFLGLQGIQLFFC